MLYMLLRTGCRPVMQAARLFPNGSELSSVSDADFHVYTCSFPEELLSGIGDALACGSLDDVSSAVEAIRVGALEMEKLQRGLQRICHAVRKDSTGLSNAASVSYLTRDLPTTLLSAIASKQCRCPATTGAKRQAALARAEAFIEQHARDGIRVGDICRAAGVSERTLQYAFVDRFGIGPKEFLNAFRLLSVRRELRMLDPRTANVSDVANAWGFWHMGQFAADYQERYEELPSQTLRDRTVRNDETGHAIEQTGKDLQKKSAPPPRPKR